MIRASLTSIEALSPLVRVIRAEEFDVLVDELKELRRRERERMDLVYEERAAVVAWLREHGEHYHERRNHHRAEALWDAAYAIECGEHRREEER